MSHRHCPAKHGQPCICWTDPAFIRMPADFHLQTAYWRNRARRERAHNHDGTDPWTGLTITELDQELIEDREATR